MKSLYKENWSYTEDGCKLFDEIHRKIESVMEQYVEMGYSPREISHIIQSSIGCAESEIALSYQMKKYRDKQK